MCLLSPFSSSSTIIQALERLLLNCYEQIHMIFINLLINTSVLPSLQTQFLYLIDGVASQ